MKKLLLLLLIFPMLCFGASATFVPDPNTDFPNPERGFYVRLQANEFCNGVADQYINKTGANAAKYNVALRIFEYEFNLATYAADVAANGSNSQFAKDMACARARGVKALVFPEYCAVSLCAEGYNTSQVLGHLASMKPQFLANRDVIAYAQFGVIGAWGQGYDSGSGLDYVGPRTAIQNAYLDALPPEVMIYSNQNIVLMAQKPTPVSPTEAFNGSGNTTVSSGYARVGFANYGFMSSSNDNYQFAGPLVVPNQSSYGGNTGWSSNLSKLQQRQWAAAQTEFTPFIAETDQNLIGDGTERRGCNGLPGGIDGGHTGTGLDGAGLPGGILNEGPRYHLISAHLGWYQPFLDRWVTDGCMGYVSGHMGYRIQYNAISHPDSASKGTTFVALLDLQNTGWARHLIERRVQLILSKSGASDIACMSNSDLRLLASQATTPTRFQINCPIPAGAATGVYAVKLKMPDKTPALQSVRMFTARPANANNGAQVWDDSAGTFATGTTVTVN